MSIIKGQFVRDRTDARGGRYDGEKADVTPPTIRRTREERRQARAGMILKLQLEGWHIDDIADLYKIKRSHAYFEVRDMPPWYRDLVEEEFRRRGPKRVEG